MPEPTLLPVSRTLADWDAPLSHDLATVFRAFAEAPDRIAATAADLSWELVARRVPDAATIAWLLLRRALTAALGEALANARLRPAGNKLDEAPANAAAQTVAIPADFLDDPATLPIVPLATDLLRQFASAHGLTPGLAGAVADRLPALFARRVYDERALASRELAPLQEAIGGRWAEDPWERAWREARAGWQAAAQAPVGGSPLAIDCFRVAAPGQAPAARRRPGDRGPGRRRASSLAGAADGRRHLAPAHWDARGRAHCHRHWASPPNHRPASASCSSPSTPKSGSTRSSPTPSMTTSSPLRR